jgi:hypothetical protein
MTSELSHAIAGRARALQHQLNQPGVVASVAAAEAMHIFADVNDDVRCRWLTLELRGYDEHVDSRALHYVLGVPPDHRLVAHVTAYRTQRGVDATPGQPAVEFRHFFIEPLSALEAARAKVATAAGGSTLLLDFGRHPRDAHYPTAGEFTRGIFDRIVIGFVAALQLQLGALTA